MSTNNNSGGVGAGVASELGSIASGVASGLYDVATSWLYPSSTSNSSKSK